MDRPMSSAPAMSRAARSGSVAASASAMLTSALPFRESPLMDRAMRSARSGSLAASAPAMLTSALPLNALPFQGSSVMDWAL